MGACKIMARILYLRNSIRKANRFRGMLLLVFCSLNFSTQATNYYINNVQGTDANSGLTKHHPWKTIAPLSNVILSAGDSVFFASGQEFSGPLVLNNSTGAAGMPIYIGAYTYNGNKQKPLLDAGNAFYSVHLLNVSFIEIDGLEITGVNPVDQNEQSGNTPMRCGVLVEYTKAGLYESVTLRNLSIHDVYLMPKGFKRTAAETQTANGTQGYGWGIRFINNTRDALLKNVQVLQAEIYNVSHTGLKFTATTAGIQQVNVADCYIHDTGGPGLQLSGVRDGYILRNRIDHSGSVADSRNWGRGSGMWTWDCRNMLIEHNRFTNANGPGDSAGVHIDYNCSDVVIQYNLSANNAGGFCEILGNNYNCAYRYNVSINDGHRLKGVNGAFQEGKIFWLSGYVGNNKKNTGPFNSYFYNNTIYVAKNIVPKIAISSSASGVLIANNIFYFEGAAQMVAGDQKKKEVDLNAIPNVVFTNNLFLKADNWPADCIVQDVKPLFGDPLFINKGGMNIRDYIPGNMRIVKNRSVTVVHIPQDTVGLRIGLKVKNDILGNPIKGQPDLGAIELTD